VDGWINGWMDITAEVILMHNSRCIQTNNVTVLKSHISENVIHKVTEYSAMLKEEAASSAENTALYLPNYILWHPSRPQP
jgi:hypothetical protein